MSSAPKPQDEKITINLGLVDLGQIDLLVEEGFNANRTDFIRTAIRRQLESRAGAVDDSVARRTLTLGTRHVTREELEELRDAGRTVELRVLGLASIADDVPPDLALATIAVAVVAALAVARTATAAARMRVRYIGVPPPAPGSGRVRTGWEASAQAGRQSIGRR